MDKYRKCEVCKKNKTYRLIDSVPVCDTCLIRDAKGGKVKDYTSEGAKPPS